MFKNDIVIHKGTKRRYVIIDEFIVEPEGEIVMLKDTWDRTSIPKKVDKRTLLNEYHKVGEDKQGMINVHDISIGDLVILLNHESLKHEVYPVVEIYECKNSEEKHNEGMRVYMVNAGQQCKPLFIHENNLCGVVRCLK